MSWLKTFLKNLKCLFKVDLAKEPMDVGALIENLLYLIPNSSIKRPKVLKVNQTIDLLCNTQKSLARFGDGEISILYGYPAIFQKYDERLEKLLRQILENKNDNLLIGINRWYFYPKLDPQKNDLARNFILSEMPKFRTGLIPLLNFSSVYCNATISDIRCEKNKKNDLFFNKLKSIWNGQNVVLVGCPQARQKLKFNIFDNAASQNWVYIPNTDAFDQYDVILERIKTFPKGFLVILMAGPTAKVLAWDLSRCGYRALDLGHIAKSYDLYMRGIKLTAEIEQEFWQPDR